MSDINWKRLKTPQEQCRIYCDNCGCKWRSENGWLYDDSEEAVLKNKMAFQQSGLQLLMMKSLYFRECPEELGFDKFQKFRYLCDICAKSVKPTKPCNSCGKSDHSRKTSKKCINYVPKEILNLN